MEETSLYVHIPFCRHRCSYCDFNTYAGMEALIDDYVQALCSEAAALAESAGERIRTRTVFFGGGTPSLLSLRQIQTILTTLREQLEIVPGAEITLEANPGTVNAEFLAGLKKLGVNRLSMGVQSAQSSELRLLEREHDFGDVIQGMQWARQAGFENVSIDLIFGLPYQNLEAWQRNLEPALGLEPDHISLYALSLEHGTPLKQWVGRGLLPEPDADLAADMYEWTMDVLRDHGFVQYEISNWARKNGSGIKACRHNLQYWRNEAYIGLGAGAHGFIGGYRTENVLAPRAYTQRFLSATKKAFPRTPATVTARPVGRHQEMRETMMMGLRLVEEGVSRRYFAERFGVEPEDMFGEEIALLAGRGLLEWAGDERERLRLTPGARFIGNQVFRQFV